MEIVQNTITKINPFIAYLEYFNVGDNPSDQALERSLSLMIRSHLRTNYFCSSVCSIKVGDFDQDVGFDEDGNARVALDFLLDPDLFDYEEIVYSLFENKPYIVSEAIEYKEWYYQHKFKELTYPSGIDGDPEQIRNAQDVLTRAVATNPEIPKGRFLGLVGNWLKFFTKKVISGNNINGHFTYKDVQPQGVSYQFVSRLLYEVGSSLSCIVKIMDTPEGVRVYKRHQLEKRLEEVLKSHNGIFRRYDNPLVHPVCSRCKVNGICPISIEYTQKKLDLMGQELNIARSKYLMQIVSFLQRKLSENGGEYLMY